MITAQITWQRISPESEDFSVRLPEELKFIKKTEDSQTSIGSLKLHIYQANQTDEYDNIYVISYLNYHDSLALDSQLKDSLLLVSLENLPGETMYYDKSEGLQYDYYTVRKNLEDQGLTIKARLFFIQQKLYMMMVYSPDHKMLNRNIDQYLSSFSIKQAAP